MSSDKMRLKSWRGNVVMVRSRQKGSPSPIENEGNGEGSDKKCINPAFLRALFGGGRWATVFL